MLNDLRKTKSVKRNTVGSISKWIVVSTLSILGFSNSLSATNFNVTNTNDNGPGSLRAAVVAANFDASATPTTPHIIDLTGLSGTIVLDSALTDIRNHVILNGPSNNGLTIERNISGAGFSVLTFKPVGLLALTAEMNNLVITKGSSLTGGGVYVENTNLTINKCRITKNFVNNGLGGGICTNNANVTINKSTIDYNTNLAGLGGGIYMNFGSLNMTNSTVFGNRAAIGGGLDKATIGTVVIKNCTFAYDTADDVGGGIYVNLGNVEANNTIITGNTAVNGASAVFGNLFSSNGHNLVDNALGMNFTGNTTGNVLGLQTNKVISNQLQNNGGVTPTVLLLACSGAINAGTNVGAPATDQRGFVRANYGSAYDIGAVEYSGPVVQDQFVCGTQTITIVASGATNYRWYDAAVGGNILLEGSNLFTATVSSDTTFWVVDYTPDCESPVRVPVHITKYQAALQPVVSAIGSTTFCQGDSVVLSSSTSPDYASYQWAPGLDTTISMTAHTSGSYSVTITDNNGCTAQSNSVTVTALPLPIPVITPSGSTVICQGSSVNLTSSSSTGNLWSTGETTQTITVSSAQTVTLTVTDANGCSGTSAPLQVSIVPTSPPDPVITASGSLDICVGSSVTLTSSYASGNVWSPNNETTESITVTQAGTYSVTFTDANGCFATSLPVIVNMLPQVAPPVVSAIGATTFCEGDSVVLSVTSSMGSITWNPGNIVAQSITVTNTGSYTAMLTDANSCTAVSLPVDVVVNANPAQPSINVFGATTFCQAQSVTLYSSSNMNNLWTPGGQTTSSIIANSSGSYVVTVTNSEGCTAVSDPVLITVLPEPTAPVVTANGPTTFCIGESVVLSSNIANNIVWSNGFITPDITISLSGNYSVTVTDSNGCSAQSNIIDVVVNNPGIAQISGNNQFCLGGSTQLAASNGSGFLWSPNGETTQTINVTTSGIYTVTVTGPNGCTSTSAPFLVTNYVNSPVTVSPSGTVQICDNSSVVLTSSISSGLVWSPNSETTPSITVSDAGSYFVTATDSNGCTSTSNIVTVIELPSPPQPIITPAGPIVQCGGSVVLETPMMQNSTYLWSDNITDTTQISVNQSGAYSVTVTANNGCSSTSNPTLVTIESMPVVNLGSDITQCGGTVTLNAGNPGATYLWSTGETTQSISLSSSASVSVIVTNSCGSVTSNTITVTINNTPVAPTVSPSGPLVLCNGTSQTLTSSAVAGNLWNTGETTSTINVSVSGNYFTTITDVNGCTAASNIVAVTIDNPITQVNIGNNITQCGGSVTLNAGNPGATYLWSNGATTQSITVSASGVYSVEVSNACGSVTSNAVNITIHPLPTVPIITASGPLAFCQGSSVVLSSSEANGNTWSTGATTPSIVVSNSGTYTVIFTDVNGCTATSVPVSTTQDIPLIAPNLGGPYVQCGGSIQLNAGIFNGSTSYLWNNGATTPAITINQSGNYNVIVTNSCGSVQSNNAEVTINPNPPAPVITALGQTTFCTGGSLILSANVANDIVWNTGETTQTITVTQSGSYYVIFNNGNNCSATSQPITVTVQDQPVAPNLGGPYNQCGGSITLDAGNATPGTIYLWNTNATTQTLTVQQSGTYFVTIANSCGSVQSSSAVVQINAVPTAPVISASGVTTLCIGDSITLTSSPKPSYLWNTGDTTQSITVGQSGNYFVNYIAANGCSATSNTITVTVQTPPTATNLGGPYNQCGGVVILDAGNANNGVSYLWSNGETSQTITVTTSGDYSVQMTNSCGSISSTTANVTLFTAPNAPVISASGSTIFCQGGSVDLNSNIPNNIVWSNNQTSSSITVTSSGSYFATYTDANGCTAVSNTITVQVGTPLSTPSLGGPYTQCGGFVTLDAGNAGSGAIYLWNNGQTSQTITVTQDGTYWVQVSNSCGSETSDTAVVNINPLPVTPIISANGPLTFCQGANVILTSSSANNNVWSYNGEITQSITVDSSATITVSVSDSLGCSATSLPITIQVDAPIAAPITLGGPYTQCGGSVALNAGNAGNSASYLWSNAQTTPSIQVTQSGDYWVQVTNSCGTVISDTAQVLIAPAAQTPIITANGPTTICQGSSVQLTSDVTNNITWSPGNQTSASITVTQSGVYSVAVDNGNGCTASSQPITVTVLNNIQQVTLGTDIVQCGGSVNVDAGFQAGANYIWTDLSGNNQIPQGQTASITSNATLFVIVSNQCNSVTSDTIQITINPLPDTPTIQANGPTTFCSGDSVQLEVVTGGGNIVQDDIIVNGDFDAGNSNFNTQYTYQSNLQPEGTIFVTPNASLNHPSFQGVGYGGIGDNFLCVNGSSNAGQFIWQQTVTVVPNETYSISAFLASMVANNNSGQIQLRIDGVDVGSVWNCPNQVNNWVPFTETWTAGSNTSAVVSLHSMNNASGGNDFGIDRIQMLSNTPNGGSPNTYVWSNGDTATSTYVNSTGSYTVTVYDALGCSATSLPIDVLVENPPFVDLGGPYTQCGGSVTLDAQNQGATYLWSNGDTTQTIEVSAIGLTTVTVTITNSCGTFTSAPVDVNILTPPAQAIISANGPLTFCQGDSVILTASNGSSYLWSPNGETSQSIVVNQSGTYSVQITAANGCTSEATPVTVNILPGSGTPAQITASGPTTFCLGSSVVLSSNSPTGNLWNNGSNQQNITVFSSGTYILNVTNANGCFAGTDTVVVTTLFNPTAIITLSNSPQLCQGDSLILTVNPNASYQWSQIINNQVVLMDTTQSITVDTAGFYTVTVTGANGCTTTAQDIQVSPAPAAQPPVISVSGQLACGTGGSVELTATGGSNFLWSTGSHSSVLTVTAPGLFAVTSQNAYGCKATSDSVWIAQGESNMEISLTAKMYESEYNIRCPKGSDGEITATVSNGQEPYIYSWSNGATTAIIDGLKGGEDNVYKVTVTDAYGCTAADSTTLIEPPSVLEKMPRGFSPDGNGVNDELVIPGLKAYADNNITIFNRWGNEVYNSNGPYKNDWKGWGKNGEDLPVGTYFIVLTADSPECGKIDENRWIELRRK